jgi:hypothetical protein
MKGTATVKLRPVKVAFLIDPREAKSLLRAIELNSSLWGGGYNPIIPVYKRIPKKLKSIHEFYGHTPKSIVKGYIEAFNPDFLVPIGKAKEFKLENVTQQILEEKSLDINLTDATPDYGAGVFEVLNGFFEKELKFKRKYPHKFIFPILGKEYPSFFRSIFGSHNNTVQDFLNENWKEPLEAEEVKIDFENYVSQMRLLTTSKITRTFQIKANNSGRDGTCIFLLDAKNNQDIIDFWNLRAMGWHVLPVPIQAMTLPSTIKASEEFIKQNSGTHRRYQNIQYRVTLLKARSIEEKYTKEFANSLNVGNTTGANGPRFSIQNWYPRIWDEWAREQDGVGYCDIESRTQEYDFDDDSNEFSVKTVDPEFTFQFGGHHALTRFANDVSISNYSIGEMYAGAIPEGGKNLIRTLSALGGLSEWRFSKRSTTFLSNFKNANIHLKLPKAQDVFTSWMLDQGIEIKLSPPGRVAMQMIKHLGGLHGINSLANENLISLLKAMERGKDMAKEQFLGEIAKVASSRRFSQKPTEALKRYMDRHMFQLGVTLQCDTCTDHSWHDIKSLDYNVICPNCLEEFSIPTHSPNDIKWSYKTIGPFSLPGGAKGVYSTLLTLRVFSNLLHDSPITPMLSFEAKIEGSDMEIDLGLFHRQSRHRENSPVKTIFAECKSENDFKKEDIEKMKILASKFPGAVLIFSTFKEELCDNEKRLLKPLVNKCRRLYKNNEPYNPVMILTKTELFAEWNLEHTWKEKGGKWAPFGNRNYFGNELMGICDVTQQLYLGMEPWEKTAYDQLERRRQKRITPPAETQT